MTIKIDTSGKKSYFRSKHITPSALKAQKESIRVDGVEDVVAMFNRKIKAMERVTPKAMAGGGLIILKRAQQLAPVKTGNLRGSGFMVTGKKGVVQPHPIKKVKTASYLRQTIDAVKNMIKNKYQVVIGFGAEYARRIHFETWVPLRNGLHYFLYTAVREKRKEAIKKVRDITFKEAQKARNANNPRGKR